MLSKKVIFSVALFWSVLFLINFGHGAGWAGVYSILITKIGTETMSRFFLFSALGGFALNLGLMFFADVLSNEKLVQTSFFCFIGILMTEIAVLNMETEFSTGTFKGILILLAVLIISLPSVFIIQTWNLINKTFTPKSGASVYPVLSTAPLIGSMIGGVAAHELPAFFATESLIAIWATCIATAICATFLLNRIVEKRVEPDTKTVSRAELVRNFKEGFFHFRRSALARDLGVVFMSFWLVCTLIDFCYARTLSVTYKTSGQMASFYGAYTTVVNFSALFVQLFLGAKLIKKIGVRDGFLFLPASQAIGFLLLMTSPGLAPVVGMMFMQTLIGMSIQSNSVQMSFNIFAANVRSKIRTLLEGVINPLGGVIASLLIMGVTFLNKKYAFPVERIIPAAGIFFACVWLFFAWRIRKTYVREIEWTYRNGSAEDKKDVREALDIERKKAAS